jgi:hypothetical protein
MKIPSKRKRLVTLGAAAPLLFSFYSSRYIVANGNVFTFREYNSLVAFKGNSNKIQLLKYILLKDKNIHVFGLDLNKDFDNQTIIYSIINAVVVLLIALVFVIIVSLLYEYFSDIRSYDRNSVIGAFVIVLLIYVIMTFAGARHGPIYLNYKPPTEISNMRK